VTADESSNAQQRREHEACDEASSSVQERLGTTENSEPEAASSPHVSLRQRAEDLLTERPRESSAIRGYDSERIIHELEVHQVELEMQNEALRQSHEALQSARDRYADLYDNAPVGYITLDSSGNILQANLTLAAMLDRPREALVGQPLIHHVVKEDRDVCYLHRRSLFRTHEAQADELRVSRGDSPPLWVRLDSTVGRDQEDRTIARITVTDVTERRALDEELREQEKLAAVAQLAGGLADTFRDALASISLYAQWALADPAANNETREALNIIHEETRHATDLVDKMLDFSRVAVLDSEPRDLRGLVAESLPIIRDQLQQRIRIVTELPDQPCNVRLDPSRMRELLLNLAGNAEDAIAGVGDLRIAVERVDGPHEVKGRLPAPRPPAWVQLNVSDTGSGMSAHARSHLFEPFFSTKPGTGRGLGLAQVYGIVKLHNGDIKVGDAPGGGTLVSIRFPLAGEEGSYVPPEDASVPATLLVIEPVPQLREAIFTVLSSQGYRVLTAASESEALRLRPVGRVDAALIDIPLDLGEGDPLAPLRAKAPAIKAIAMVDHRADVASAALKRAGFNAVVSKPFAVSDLAGTIEVVLDRKE
jgi:PAS domain S-box-containing protein